VNQALEQFLTAARQLADVVGFDHIRLGAVATTAQPNIIIALSAKLVRHTSVSPAMATLTAGPVTAFQRDIPLTELEYVLQQLGMGRLQQTRDPQGRLLPLPLPLQVHPQLESPKNWYYQRESYEGPGYSFKVRAHGSKLGDIMGHDESVDALIARESNYTYSSISRVIRAFTGFSIDRSDWQSQSSKIEFVAPWPVHSLAASSQGASLLVDAEGFIGLDPSRFILNVEGSREDRRFDSSILRWQTAPAAGADRTTYTTRLDARDIGSTAVNLYIAAVPDVRLRTEVQREQIPTTVSSGVVSAAHVFGLLRPRVQPDTRRTEVPDGTRLARLQLSGFRLLQTVDLELAPPFTVIVGPNQSGKSSVLEALQLLSEAARGELSEALVRRRAGLGSLLTRGGQSTAVTLTADLVTPQGQALRYLLSVSPLGTYDFTVADEQLSQQVKAQWEPLLTRRGSQATLAGVTLTVPNERESMLSQLGMAHPVIEAIRLSLAAIAIYPYFRTGAAWVDPEAVPMRRPVRLEPGARLGRSGDNLAAVLSSMRDERPSDWEEYLSIVRLAFPRLKDLRMPVVSRGTVQLFWDEDTGQSFDASELSDGTLSFLAILCALFQPGSALIAVDEPEQHLHPDALRRLVGAARSLSDRQPILFTTQSDALIGLLDETPESVVVANRGPEGATLVRPDPEQLQEWLKTFSLREMRRDLEGWSPES
jgi:predicted ATPase